VNDNSGRPNGYSVEFRFNGGMKLSISAIYWFGESWFTNIQFCAPPRARQIDGKRRLFGLVGDFDLVRTNDLTPGNEWTIDGKPYATIPSPNFNQLNAVQQFGQRLRVPGNRTVAGDILLYRCSRKNGVLNKAKRCLLPTRRSRRGKSDDDWSFPPVAFFPQAERAPVGFVYLRNPSNVDVDADLEPLATRLDFIPPANNNQANIFRRDAGHTASYQSKEVTPAFIEDARILCMAIIGDHPCNSLEDPKNFVESCVNDCVMTAT
jgi:hypothetical protein